MNTHLHNKMIESVFVHTGDHEPNPEIVKICAQVAEEYYANEPFAQLTEMQRQVGYTEGDINIIALLGLFGEAGEVLEGCTLVSNAPLSPNTDSLHILKNNAIDCAFLIDRLKKQIRDKKLTQKITVSRHRDDKVFDWEL